ncbi:hypothetical protein Glove_689g2 [Diversispora epigaea]|uniref:Uncharacterized protein n=1 Tax=Diversispora epigaea TaxID=1348612 RepID=A0A397G688_9GLOM|nr:hypothetical protein Glove_689g2 [Diversispora epigaea]
MCECLGDKPGTRNESEYGWDPPHGELCLNRVKPEETLVEARSGSDVQIDRRIWDSRNSKQFYEVKRMIRGLGVETALTYSQTLNIPENGWRSSVIPIPRRQGCSEALTMQILVIVANIQMRTLKTEVGKGRDLFSCQVVLITAAGLQGLGVLGLDLKVWEICSAGLGKTLLEVRVTRVGRSWQECSECQSEEIQPSADSHCPYLPSSETTAKGTGLAKSAGKEDPVELDSSLTL